MGMSPQLLVFLLRVELVPPFVAATSGPGAPVLGCIIELEDLPSAVLIISLEPYPLTRCEEGHGAKAGSVALDGQCVEIRHQAPLGDQLIEGDINPLAAGIRLSPMLQLRPCRKSGSSRVGGLHPVGALLVFPYAVKVVGHTCPGR